MVVAFFGFIALFQTIKPAEPYRYERPVEIYVDGHEMPYYVPSVPTALKHSEGCFPGSYLWCSGCYDHSYMPYCMAPSAVPAPTSPQPTIPIDPAYEMRPFIKERRVKPQVFYSEKLKLQKLIKSHLLECYNKEKLPTSKELIYRQRELFAQLFRALGLMGQLTSDDKDRLVCVDTREGLVELIEKVNAL